MKYIIIFVIILNVDCHIMSHKSSEAQLYEDLLYDYNKIPRPVKNSSEVLIIYVGASLIRIIDVDEKNQVLTTNLWLEMQWTDSKLVWDPDKYGGITSLHIPSDMIWLPDFVLYNNAAGDPDITIYTDALVTYDGKINWQPPSIFKSFCPIDVTWFPYDIQNCNMKFGLWSFTGNYVDMRQLPVEKVKTRVENSIEVEYLNEGMDLSFFYRSAEWDLLSLTSARHSVLYASCCGPETYIDVTYYFVLRRKTLFFTCNLIIPCFLISALTTFVFYLSDHKITFSISILVTLTVFFLVLIDIIPPTSLVVPMFGRYLVTTMILVALSTVISVITVNFRYRRGSAYKMSPWIRKLFLECLPKLLFMSRPKKPIKQENENVLVDPKSLIQMPSLAYPLPHTEIKTKNKQKYAGEKLSKNKILLTDISNTIKNDPPIYEEETPLYSSTLPTTSTSLHKKIINEEDVKIDPKIVKKKINDIIFVNLLRQVRFIAEHFKKNEEESEEANDWTYLSLVLDRIFLIIFSILNAGAFLVILQAPSLYDEREPLNITAPTKPLGQANVHILRSLK